MRRGNADLDEGVQLGNGLQQRPAIGVFGQNVGCIVLPRELHVLDIGRGDETLGMSAEQQHPQMGWNARHPVEKAQRRQLALHRTRVILHDLSLNRTRQIDIAEQLQVQIGHLRTLAWQLLKATPCHLSALLQHMDVLIRRQGLARADTYPDLPLIPYRRIRQRKHLDDQHIPLGIVEQLHGHRRRRQQLPLRLHPAQRRQAVIVQTTPRQTPIVLHTQQQIPRTPPTCQIVGKRADGLPHPAHLAEGACPLDQLILQIKPQPLQLLLTQRPLSSSCRFRLPPPCSLGDEVSPTSCRLCLSCVLCEPF